MDENHSTDPNCSTPKHGSRRESVSSNKKLVVKLFQYFFYHFRDGILDLLLDEATKGGTSGNSTFAKKAEAQYTKICFGADSMPILVDFCEQNRLDTKLTLETFTRDNSLTSLQVRSRGGLTDVDGSTITFDAKIEYVPECGAMVRKLVYFYGFFQALSDEEWLYHYMKALLSGTRKHMLFRVHPK